MGRTVPRLLLVLSPLVALLVLGGWSGAAPLRLDAPSGCQMVFSSTTRGGASSPAGGLTCSLRPPADTVLVQRVVDGDTILLAGGERVRYVGIDAPEVTGAPEPFGAEASDFNRGLVGGKRVRLERDVSDRDRYGRLLRYVYVGGLMVEAELVREGYARAVTYSPDTKYATCMAALEREARDEGRGLWAR